jgi:hypothetical protein
MRGESNNNVEVRVRNNICVMMMILYRWMTCAACGHVVVDVDLCFIQ